MALLEVRVNEATFEDRLLAAQRKAGRGHSSRVDHRYNRMGGNRDVGWLVSS